MIEKQISGSVLTVWLNRPEVRNALNQELIGVLITALTTIPVGIRVIVIRGRGRAFCSGADLAYMEQLGHYSEEENLADALRLESLFAAISRNQLPVIVVAHGAVMGGGIGLLAAADIVLAETLTLFAFSEVKLGIVPAVISPYILMKMNKSRAYEFMITGRRFNASEAKESGLVTVTCVEELLEDMLNQYVNEFLSASPDAIARCKEMLQEVSDRAGQADLRQYTARMIAGARASEEGREGLTAFLEKRKPSWFKALPNDETI